MSVPIADYADYAARQRTLSKIAAYYSGTVNVSGVGQAERYTGAWVTASVFDIARTAPLLGRIFRPDDEHAERPEGGAHQLRHVEDAFRWRVRSARQVMRVNGQPFTIVGVMPEKFAFPDNADLWLPLQLDPLATKRGEGQGLNVVGMLKPGVTVDQAALDFAAIAKRLATEFKETNENISAGLQPFVDAYIGPEPHQLLYSMLGAVFLVLLIACANVANLLLDRAAHRTKEVGIRTALGASRGAVVRQFLTEAFVLSAAGAVGGTALAYGGITLFNRVLADTVPPFFIDIRLHPPVLAFVIALALLSTFLSGAIPAIQSSRTDINEVLKDENRGSSSLKMGRMSRALVVFEIALSCGLLVASGLMIKSVTKLRNDGSRIPDAERLHGAHRIPGDVHRHRCAEAVHGAASREPRRAAGRAGRGDHLEPAGHGRFQRRTRDDGRRVVRGRTRRADDAMVRRLGRLLRDVRREDPRRARIHVRRSRGRATRRGGEQGVRRQVLPGAGSDRQSHSSRRHHQHESVDDHRGRRADHVQRRCRASPGAGVLRAALAAPLEFREPRRANRRSADGGDRASARRPWLSSTPTFRSTGCTRWTRRSRGLCGTSACSARCS